MVLGLLKKSGRKISGEGKLNKRPPDTVTLFYQELEPRIVFDAAMEQQKASSERRHTETIPGKGEDASPFDSEVPEVDLLTLSDRSRKLLNSAILFYGFFGFWLLWSDVFPALKILDQAGGERNQETGGTHLAMKLCLQRAIRIKADRPVGRKWQLPATTQFAFIGHQQH